ncbi:hypothetical protein [Sphingomonas cavernae]|uniref:Uncharacterized protein n=1 Tax=Sphingomonas cavernae TaxID=2320861 RepID=A0A418WP88_9SPHN|nr:hypothetical protein [Sphingomonas cavernae]RJF93045.1 hypothetical protein D3876_01275 [Sphingomonas cavernae]
MPTYRLDIRMQHSDPDDSISLDAVDDIRAAEAARTAIAQAFGRPHELVMLDAQRGRFTIGAGLWSRTGHYHLWVSEDVAGLPRL